MLEQLKDHLIKYPADIYLSDQSEPHPILDELQTSGLLKTIKFAKHSVFTLIYSDHKLSVLYENQKPIFVDFEDLKLLSQIKKTNRKSLFAKALGLKKNQEHLIDLTAGLGKDSFVVSKYFSKVTWVEQNPIVYLLLQDGLVRYRKSQPEKASQFHLIFGDAHSYLESLNSASEATLYFDFMFADKKSKSNKDMFFLKHITQNDPGLDLSRTLESAVKKTISRTVLKAKNYHESFAPKQVYAGPTIKYFVYK